jgi:hypothetical protein
MIGQVMSKSTHVLPKIAEKKHAVICFVVKVAIQKSRNITNSSHYLGQKTNECKYKN